MTFWVVQFLNGLAFSSLLFLLSVGFTLIFGLMRTLKLTHGAFFALGGYVGLSIYRATNNFILAVLVGGLSMIVLGLLQHKFLLHRFHGVPLNQVLLTLGLWLFYDDLILVIWGGYPHRVAPPASLAGSFSFFGVNFPQYRFVLILVGVVVAILVWLIIEKTKLGAIIRAGSDNEEIARAMGINVNRVFFFAFGFGAFLAGVAGVLGGPMLGLEPSTSRLIMPLALVVVIVGGLGSLKGAMVGSLFVGLIDNFGRALFPDLAYFTLFAPMALVLIFRPQGLFGRK